LKVAGKLKITLVKSFAGRPEKHRKILRSMGLRKVGRTVEHPDRPEHRGMIAKISHLVEVEEV